MQKIKKVAILLLTKARQSDIIETVFKKRTETLQDCERKVFAMMNMCMQTAAGACQCRSTGFFAMSMCANASDMGVMNGANSANSANGYIYGVDLCGALLFCLFALLLSSTLALSLVLVHIFVLALTVSIIIRITWLQFNKRSAVPPKSGDAI